MPQLPLDLYVSILEQLPASRAECDGALTLVHCLQTNRLLREAALVPSLWENHYRVRYLHSEELDESHRKTQFNGNWRLMYAERRRRDKLALQLLDEMVSLREGRYRRAATLASMSFDVWDVLEIECSLPVPAMFGGNTTETPAPYALTRQFWAENILGSISRRFAIMQWGRLANRETENSVSFVDAFSSLSCFFGRPPQEMNSHLIALGIACREYLVKRCCPLDPAMPEYDLPDVCAKICHFMREQGFSAVEPTRFYDISNHFPHVYLTTNRRSIPISLVHIFVCLARNVGILASPVEFPTRVLVHIPSPPGADDFLVDVYGADTKAIVSLRNDIPAMLMRLGISPNNLSQYVSPCGAAPMLLRTARNILSSFRNDASRATAQSAIYAAVCIHLLLTNETQLVAHMLSHVDLDPLYCATFLSDLQPLLRHGCQHLLESSCRNALEVEEEQAGLVHPRTAQAQITHYVGMVFEHRLYHYMGCIIGWEPTCLATDEWQNNMNVGSLPRGANQPFYHVLSIDGSQRYVADDNIVPTILTPDLALQFFNEVPVLPRYFSDVTFSGRGRWRSSPELQQAYPDDERVSQTYDEFGSL
ncbi:YccV-like-domain-containing protein [Mycena epipterygia]|nr:YccV-like-domain-containing protein [Mycena epipterygia]